MECFYKQEGKARELLTKEKKGLFFRPRHLLEGREQGFIMQIASFLGDGMESTHMIEYLIHVDQKIPDWFIKIVFLGEQLGQVSSLGLVSWLQHR